MTPGDIKILRELGAAYDPEARNVRLSEDLIKIGQEVCWQECANSPEFFILDSGLLKTLDRREKYDCHSCGEIIDGKGIRECQYCLSPKVSRRHPIQPFPKDLKYLRDMCHVYQTEAKIALVKSRRMLVTEFTCGWESHGMYFREGFFSIIQADKEDKSNDNVEKVHGMLFRLPDWMKARRPVNPSHVGRHVKNTLHIPCNKSRILGVPEGPDQIRLYGPSLYWADEMAFWPRALETYGAVLPAIEAGCQFIATSTAASGFYDGLCNDILDKVA